MAWPVVSFARQKEIGGRSFYAGCWNLAAICFARRTGTRFPGSSELSLIQIEQSLTQQSHDPESGVKIQPWQSRRLAKLLPVSVRLAFGPGLVRKQVAAFISVHSGQRQFFDLRKGRIRPRLPGTGKSLRRTMRSSLAALTSTTSMV